MGRAETIARGAASGRLAVVRFPVVNSPPDCLHCGACCFSPSERFVRVTGDDWERLEGIADGVAQFVGHRAYMRMTGGHCAALELRVDETGEAKFFCTIYERRPQICRDLARGSPECAGERALRT
jgi:Fe-S-cluster containining protein